MMRRGVGALGALAATGLLILGACSWDTSTKTDEATVDGSITKLRFDNDSGDVTVRVGDQASVKRVINYRRDAPDVQTHRVESDELILESCPTNNCWIDYEVVVPEGTVVDGEVGSGDITVSGVAKASARSESGDIDVRDIDGDAQAEAGSGHVNASGIAGASTLQADSGDIEATGLSGASTAESSSGSITLTLSQAQNVRAEASSGNVSVTVPAGSYRVATDTGSGDVNSDVANSDDGAHQIDLHTNSGDVTLRQG